MKGARLRGRVDDGVGAMVLTYCFQQRSAERETKARSKLHRSHSMESLTQRKQHPKVLN